jgi:hypothetical protein
MCTSFMWVQWQELVFPVISLRVFVTEKFLDLVTSASQEEICSVELVT